VNLSANEYGRESFPFWGDPVNLKKLRLKYSQKLFNASCVEENFY
jgi:hypothetical protein